MNRNLIFFIMGYVAIITGLIMRRWPLSPFGDEAAYIDLSLLIGASSEIPDLGSLRTYGYPLLISFFSKYVSSNIADVVFVTFLAQAAMFAGVVLCFVLSIKDDIWRRAIFAGLLLNPLIIDPIISVLTEGPTLILAVAMATLLIRAERARDGWRVIAFLSAGSGLAAFALVVRPANVGLLVAWWIAAAACLMLRRRGWRESAGVFIGSVALACVAFYPQIALNTRYYQKFTVFPPVNLQDHQLGLGLKLWKYGTSIASGPMNYKNPFFIDWPTGPTFLSWYWQNGLAGPLTLISHVFNAFSFDYPFIYVMEDRIPSGHLAFAVWTFVFLGAIHAARLVHASWIFRKYPKFDRGILVFGVMVVAQAIALISITAVENRFAVLPLGVLSIMAVHAALSAPAKPLWQRVETTTMTLTLSAIATVCTLAMSDLMLSAHPV